MQDNYSRSSLGVLRGLHYQLTQAQGKLVRVTRGAVFDVAVDVREDSPILGNWCGATLDEKNMHMMYIPPVLPTASWYSPILPTLYTSALITTIQNQNGESYGLTLI